MFCTATLKFTFDLISSIEQDLSAHRVCILTQRKNIRVHSALSFTKEWMCVHGLVCVYAHTCAHTFVNTGEQVLTRMCAVHFHGSQRIVCEKQRTLSCPFRNFLCTFSIFRLGRVALCEHQSSPGHGYFENLDVTCLTPHLDVHAERKENGVTTNKHVKMHVRPQKRR